MLLMISFSGCNEEQKDQEATPNENTTTNNDENDEDDDTPYQSYSSRLFGTWKSEQEYNNSTTIISYTFYPDFTFSTYYLFENINRTGSGTWFVYDSSLSMTLFSVNETAVFDIEFSSNDTVLQLIDEQQNVITLEKTSL